MGAILIDRWPSDDVATAEFRAVDTAGPRWGSGNLQKYTLDKAYRSDSVTAFTQLVLEFDAFHDLDSFALAGHNILSTDIMTLTYADDAAFLVNAVNVPLTWNAGVIWATFASMSKKHMGLRVTKTDSSNYIQIGRMVTGNHTELSVGLKTPGDQGGVGVTTATRVPTKGGQIYGTIAAASEKLSGTFPALVADDIDELEFIKRTYQISTAFFMIIRAGQTNENAFYGVLDKVNTYRFVTPDDRDIPWSMTEQK